MKSRTPRRHTSLRTSALFLALVMLGPVALPAVNATHVNEDTHDLPEAGPVRIDDKRCFDTEIQQIPPGLADALQRSRDEGSPGPFWEFVEEEGNTVPRICFGESDPNEDPQEEYVAAVGLLNAALATVRDVMHLVENQSRFRQESYIPYNFTPALYDGFEDHWADTPRRGGYGDWRVVSALGPEEAWHHEDRAHEFENPRGVWRFSDPEGPHYPTPAATALVSPLVDLAAVDVGPGARDGQYFCQLQDTLGQCVHAVTGPRDTWELMRESALATARSQGIEDQVEGLFATANDALLPMFASHETQGAAVLQIHHRYNLANGLDGVRLEVWDHEPTPQELRDLARYGTREQNLTHGVDGVWILEPVAPDKFNTDEYNEHQYEERPGMVLDDASDPNPPRQGGFPSKRGNTSRESAEDFGETRAFRPLDETMDRASAKEISKAFTGYSRHYETAAFDLSRFAGKQVHIVFHARTGITVGDYFTDKENFESDIDYGYFLDTVNLTTTAKPHNLRVWTEPAAPSIFLEGEDEEKKFTLLPPGEGQDVRFYVTNFGRYVEQASVEVVLECVQVCTGMRTRFNDTATLQPGEVWQMGRPWPFVSEEGEVWEATVTARLPPNSGGVPSGSPGSVTTPSQPGDPVRVNASDSYENADPWQPRDEAYYGVDKDNTQKIRLHVIEERRVDVVTPPGQFPVRIQPSVADKDKPRTIAVTFRNTGNTVEDVRAEVIVEQDGRRFDDFFVTPNRVDVGWLAPGEEKTLRWELRPYVTGAFETRVAFTNASNPSAPDLGASPLRILYAGRTSGVICSDDIHFARACTASWSLDRPQALQLTDPVAAWRAPDGDVWVVGRDALVMRYADTDQDGEREWIDMADATDPRVLSPFEGTEDLLAVTGHAVGSGYVVYAVGNDSAIWRYDGTWSRLGIDAFENADGDVVEDPNATFRGAWAADADTVFVAGDHGLLLELNATSGNTFRVANLTQAAKTHLQGLALRAVGGLDDEKAWAVGDRGAILVFDGTTWRVTRAPTFDRVGLFAIHVFPSGDVLAGGENGIILRWTGTSTQDAWDVVREPDVAAPAIRAFATSPSDETSMVPWKWALGEDGVLLRCGDCNELDRTAAWSEWVSTTPVVPFFSVDVEKPVLTNGRHFVDRAEHALSGTLGAPVTFRVTYTDVDGERPSEVTLMIRNATGTWKPYEMRLLRGTFTGGALYEVTLSSETITWSGVHNPACAPSGHCAPGTASEYSTGETRPFFREVKDYPYYFIASDGTFSVQSATAADAVKDETRTKVRIGGDMNSGVWDAPENSAAPLAQPVKLFPPFSNLEGRIEGGNGASADKEDWYAFLPEPGQTFRAAFNHSASSDVVLYVVETVRDAEGNLVPGEKVAILGHGEQSEVRVPETAEPGPWLIGVAHEDPANAGSAKDTPYKVSIVTLPERGSFPFPLETHATPPSTTQARRTAADILAVADDGGSGDALAIVQSGYVLRFNEGPVYENTGDWDPDYHLRSLNPNGIAWSGGGPDLAGVLHFSTNETAAIGTVASAKLTLRHNLWEIDATEADPYPEVRLVFEPTRSPQYDPVDDVGGTTVGVSLGPQAKCTSSTPENDNPQQRYVCNRLRQRVVHQYDAPHDASGWVTETFDVANIINGYLQLHPGSTLAGVELYIPAPKNPGVARYTQWAVDELRLDVDGEAAIHWAGANMEGRATPMAYKPGSAANTLIWKETTRPLFGYGNGNTPEIPVKSLWHRSALAEQPVWVANNEATSALTLENGDHLGGLSSWLVTPAVDLRQTATPVIEFKHAFSGRLRHLTGDSDCLDVADVGRVMMQVQDPVTGEWSRWHGVVPEGGYPGRGYNGLPDKPICGVNIGGNPGKDELFQYGTGFFHRTKPLDEFQSSGNLLRLDNFETVRVDLAAQDVQFDGEPVNVKGKVARFAFAFNTSRSVPNAVVNIHPIEHAGWYVTDFRVLGERTLGQDLRVTDFAPVVGYDWNRIGFGPSTATDPVTIPLRLNVTNAGLFDVPGFQATLEAVEVLDSVQQVTRTVQVDAVRYDQIVKPGEVRPINMSWRVPVGAENTTWMLRVVVTPLGAEDENPADNVAKVGSVAYPVPVTRFERVGVRAEAIPRAEAADIARFIPVYLVNEGNVPLKDFTLTRRIYENRGGQGKILLDERSWRTERAVPPGERLSVSYLNTTVDIFRDLYWTPPAQGAFLVEATLEKAGSPILLRNRVSVDAFSTYLFDDAEGDVIGAATRGAAASGGWETTGNGWGVVDTGGFDATGGYHFGDFASGTYPESADASLVTPLVDLSSATTARLTFFHKFDFEEGYDGGIVEASTDGGKTWQILEPEANERFALPDGYSATNLTAASPLDADQDPWTPTRGFTGDSSKLEGNLDGWITSQFDLGQIRDLVEETDYVNFTADAAADVDVKECAFTPTDEARALCERKPYYADDSWVTGDTALDEYWDYRNVRENAVTPVDPEAGFFWSGSWKAGDDDVRLENVTVLNLTLDLTSVDKESDEKIELRFRDWMLRDALHVEDLLSKTATGPIGPVIVTESDSGIRSYRTNWTGSYFVTEKDGLWWNWSVDLSAHKGNVTTLRFIYDPFKSWGSQVGDKRPTPNNVQPAGMVDPGWILDDMEVVTTREMRGRTQDAQTLYTMRDIVGIAQSGRCDYRQSPNHQIVPQPPPERRTPVEVACLVGGATVGGSPTPKWYEETGEAVPVTDDGIQGAQWAHYSGRPEDVVALPASHSGWSTIGLESDKDYIYKFVDHNGAKRLRTGEENRVFWSGTKNVSVTEPAFAGRNVEGGQDKRLVTPAIDLGRVAGKDAHLDFWHFYGFHMRAASNNHLPRPSPAVIGDLGVVEVQVWDPVRNAWGPWQQLYDERGYGGYPSRMGLDYYLSQKNNDPLLVGSDLPVHEDPVTGQRYVYGFMGTSVARNEHKYGWVNEKFDLSDFIGDRVRLGFRQITVAVDPDARGIGAADGKTGKPLDDILRAECAGTLGAGTAMAGLIPTVCLGDKGPGQGGWFIDEVRVVGETLAGKPVTLRFRAGTDEDISKGGWTIDDIAIAGATYNRNVGVFLEDVPTGGAPGRTTWVNGTLRNLADTVRRGLSVEIRDASREADGSAPRFPLTFEVEPVAGGTPYVDPVDPLAALSDVTLPARGAMPFSFKVTVPEGATGERRLIVRAVESRETNDPSGATRAFSRITDNEVEGFLLREIPLAISESTQADPGLPVITPAAADVGEEVTITVPLENRGFVPVTFRLDCEARHVHEWEKIDHADRVENIPVYDQKVPCTSVQGDVTLRPESTGSAVFTFTPQKDGFWHFAFEVDVVDDAGKEESRTVGDARLIVGRQPFFFQNSFETQDARKDWASQKGEKPWSLEEWVPDQDRARTGNWSFRAGVSDRDFMTGERYEDIANYTLISPWIDLHNASDQEPLFLRFNHLPRFAFGDGADVHVEILRDEKFPVGGASGVTCKIHPTTGYDGPVWSYWTVEPPEGVHSNDSVPAWWQPQSGFGGPEGRYASDGSNLEPGTAKHAAASRFVSDKHLFFTGFREQWRTAEFNLKDVECPLDAKKDSEPVPVLGYTVRFHFTLSTGRADGDIFRSEYCGDPDQLCDDLSDEGILRGRGQAWFLDDITVSGYNLNFSAPEATYLVKDNATKRFPSRVWNDARFEDHVNVFVDKQRSSAPEGTASVRVDNATLPPDAPSTVAWTEVQMPRDPGLLPILYQLRVVAQSAMDPTIERERMIGLDFFPEKYPDLRVSVDVPNARVQEGSKAMLPITVENAGLVESAPPAIIIVEEHGSKTRTCVVSPGTSGDRLKSDEGCTSLGTGRSGNRPIASFYTDPDASTVVYPYHWTPLEGKGDHKLTIIVDPLNEIEEYTKSDNRATVDVKVTELLQPDLVLEDTGVRVRAGGVQLAADTASGDLRRFEVQENEVVTVDVVVKNRGPVGATNVDIRAFIGPLALPPKTVAFIPAGSEVVVPFTWQAQKGEWALQFSARTDLVELDDTNNRVPRTGFVILTVKGFEVSALLDFATDLVDPGSVVPMTLTLANDGVTPEEVVLRSNLPEGWTARFDANDVFLRKGETGSLAREVPVTITVPADAVAGEHVITVEAVSRENSMKVAVGTGKVTVRAIHGATVTTARHVSPPGEVYLPLTVTNTGNSPAPMAVSADLPDGWRLAEESPAISVAPYATETEILRLVTPTGTRVGDYRFNVALALGDGSKVTEPVTVEIKPWRQIRFTPVSETPVTAEALAFDVKAENVGNVRAPFTLLTPGLPEDWKVQVTPSGATLAPGESQVFRVIVTPPAGVELGEWSLPLQAHFEGVQPGSPEGRANRGDLAVRLVRPDLAVEEFTFTPRVEIQPLTRIAVRAPVQNLGNREVTDFQVALFVDDVLIEVVDVARLAPGERVDVLFNWTAVGGKHAMSVVADPFKDVLEAGRENNAATRVVVVEGEQQTVRGVPAQTVETPGPTLVAFLGIVVAAAVALRSTRRSNR